MASFQLEALASTSLPTRPLLPFGLAIDELQQKSPLPSEFTFFNVWVSDDVDGRGKFLTGRNKYNARVQEFQEFQKTIISDKGITTVEGIEGENYNSNLKAIGRS